MLWILRKNHCDLTAEERGRLRTLFTHSPLLHQAYTFREELTAIFNRHSPVTEAEVAIQAWFRKVEATSLPCYDTFIKTVRRYWTFILNYFKQRIWLDLQGRRRFFLSTP